MIGFDSGPEPTDPPREPPADAPSSPPAADDWTEPAEPITEAQVRGYLSIAGSMAEAAVGREDGHWSFTDDELELIAPGLTSYINRHPALQRAAAQGDGGLLVYGLVGYATRNVSTELAYRDRLRRERHVAEHDPEMVSHLHHERPDKAEGVWPPELAPE